MVSVSMTPETFSLDDPAGTQFSLIATLEDGSTRDITSEAQWVSTDERVVAVENAPGTPGLAVPTGPGSASVYAEYDGVAVAEGGASASVLSSTVYVSVATGSDATGTGSRFNPVASVERGVAIAAGLGLPAASVRAAEGTYSVGSPVVITQGISLYGGYSSTTWARDPAVHVTTIQNTSEVDVIYTSPLAAIRMNSDVDDTTVIDGLTLIGGGGAGANTYSAGIVCNGCDATVTSNTIHAGTAIKHASGIAFFNDGRGMIVGNVILGPDTYKADRAFGVFSENSGPDLIGNVVLAGGTSDTNRSAGVQVGGAVARSFHIYNNVIHGGYGRQSRGIDVNVGTRNTHIRNNTIDGGSSAGGFDGGEPLFARGSSAAVVFDGGAGADLDNNILFTSGGFPRYGIMEVAPGSTGTRMRRNTFFDVSQGAYINDDWSVANNLSDLNNYLLSTGNSSSQPTGNILDAPVFADRAGGDYHLVPGTPSSIWEGGVHLDAINRFPKDPVLTSRAIDFDGNLRPYGTFWSMGAFQYDGP